MALPKRSGLIPTALCLAMIAFLAIFLLYPIGLTVRGAFAADAATGTGFTLEHVRLIAKDPVLVRGLINAGLIAVCTTALSIIIALPLAVLSARYRFPLQGAFQSAILAPLILPPFVGAIGVRALVGREGMLNTLLGTEFDILGNARFWGVVAVEALHLYPIIYLNATAALANLDPALDESAENLGAGPWRRFFTVTLPLIRPGLFAGATIVLIWSLTDLGTPLMFDYTKVTPVQVFNGLKEVSDSAEPYALTLVLLTSAVLLYVTGKFLFGRKGHAMYAKAARAADTPRLTGLAGFGAAAAFGLVTLTAILPHLGVALTAFAAPGQWYGTILPSSWTLSNMEQALGHPDAFGSIRNSLFLSLGAVFINLFIGLMVGYLIVRTKARGRTLLDSLCMLPLAVPGLVMAFGYVAMTLRWPFEGTLPSWLGFLPEGIVRAPLDDTPFDLEVLGSTPNPFPLLILAYAVRRLPYIVRSAAAGLEQTSGELEEAAVNLGASRTRAVRTVIVPLIMANLIAGSLLVFAFSMLEVSDSLILAQRSQDFPITARIFAFTLRLGDGPYIASAMGVWCMALLGATLVGATSMIGKKMGAIFRV